MLRKATVAFNDPTPEGAAFRAQQAMVDADIEGLARDPEMEAEMAEMRRKGMSREERLKRLDAYFREDDQSASAAE